MKVKPLENYRLLGTPIVLDKNTVYNAVIARNQPNYKEKGLIFVDGVLLAKGEYKIVPDKYIMQVKVEGKNGKLSWISVKGSNLSTPYEYDTRKEAEHMLNLCYGGEVAKDRLRVIKK
jgi:CYTH domain-containing protein